MKLEILHNIICQMIISLFLFFFSCIFIIIIIILNIKKNDKTMHSKKFWKQTDIAFNFWCGQTSDVT